MISISPPSSSLASVALSSPSSSVSSFRSSSSLSSFSRLAVSSSTLSTPLTPISPGAKLLPKETPKRPLKIYMCFLRGKCTRGAKCCFAHSIDELELPPGVPYKGAMCRRFVQGVCPNGDNCLLKHSAADVGQFRRTALPRHIALTVCAKSGPSASEKHDKIGDWCSKIQLQEIIPALKAMDFVNAQHISALPTGDLNELVEKLKFTSLGKKGIFLRAVQDLKEQEQLAIFQKASLVISQKWSQTLQNPSTKMGLPSPYASDAEVEDDDEDGDRDRDEMEIEGEDVKAESDVESEESVESEADKTKLEEVTKRKDLLFRGDTKTYPKSGFPSKLILVKRWGGKGDGLGHFNLPFGISSCGSLTAVSEWGNHRIQLFDGRGIFVRKFGKRGKQVGDLDYPMGICCDNKRIYVADSHNSRVQAFDFTGRSLASFPVGGQCHGVALTRDALFTTDVDNNRIKIFSLETQKLLVTLGRSGRTKGLFHLPNQVVISEDEKLYCSDRGNNRIQYFALDGTCLGSWGWGGGKVGSQPGHFNEPTGLALSQSKFIYVTDSRNHRIQVFTLQGEYITEFGQKGGSQAIGNLYVDTPRGICVKEDGYVWIVDQGNHRIQICLQN